MHKPNSILVFPGVMLPGEDSEYAKHIKTATKGQNYDLMELHSGMRGKMETINKNNFKYFTGRI